MTPDVQLLREALAGEMRSLGALVERHFGLVYTVALARLRDPEIAEDLAQEVMLRACLHLERLGPRGHFPAWVARIARNLATDWQRQGQRASRLLPMVPLEQMKVPEVPDRQAKGARETMASDQESQALREALFELPEEERELVMLHYTEGLSQSEIAERLGTTQPTVSRQLNRALARLRGRLEPLLREVGPQMRAPSRAVSRSLAFVAAASALSATAKAALVAAAPAGEIASATEAAQAGVAGVVGAIGFLKSLPTLIAGGAQAMATVKGVIATATAAVAIAGGAIYLGSEKGAPPASESPAALSTPNVPANPTRGETALDRIAASPNPISTALLAIDRPGVYAVTEDQVVELAPMEPQLLAQMTSRFQSGEDPTALLSQLSLVSIPRTARLFLRASDRPRFLIQQVSLAEMARMAPTVDRNQSGASLPFTHTVPHTVREISGLAELVLSEPLTGDLLLVVNGSPAGEQMRMARLEGDEPGVLPIPDHEGVFAVGSDGRLIELAHVPAQDMETLRRRLSDGEAGVFESMGLPTVPRSTPLLVLQPRRWYEDPSYGPGNGYEVAVIAADGGSDGVEARYRDVRGTPGLMAITFPEIGEGAALGVARGNFSQGQVEVWMARLP